MVNSTQYNSQKAVMLENMATRHNVRNVCRLGAIMIAIFLCLCSSQRSLACEPLVIFVGGFFDSVNKKMKKVYDSEKEKLDKYSNVSTTYFPWDKKSEIRSRVLRHQGTKKTTHPVVLIGYSYGGDTAYSVAKELPVNANLTLITLDPVGERAWWSIDDAWWINPLVVLAPIKIAKRDESLVKPTTGMWYNIYTPTKNWYVYDHQMQRFAAILSIKMCDPAAWVGGKYGNQLQAESIPVSGSHCDMIKLRTELRKILYDDILGTNGKLICNKRMRK